jgi:hypothetical protein
MNENIAPPPQYPDKQQAPAGQWVPSGPPLPKSSGYRVASGIVAIVLGCWLFIASMASFASNYFSSGLVTLMSLLFLVAALGNLTSGIVLLAKNRSRLRAAPVTVLTFAALPLLLGLAGFFGGYTYSILVVASSLIFSVPVFIVMGIGLSREKRDS